MCLENFHKPSSIETVLFFISSNKQYFIEENIINMCDELDWGFTSDLPEIEEDPVFDNTSPLFSSLKPVFNRQFLPRFEGSVYFFVFDFCFLGSRH